MIGTAFDGAILIDTSAVIALHDPAEQHHQAVRRMWTEAKGIVWAVLDLTSHECFTRVRYQQGWRSAMEHYEFLRGGSTRLLRFEPSDESVALDVLNRYQAHEISFHDALCFAVMKRVGLYRILTIDSDFAILGLEVFPGATR